MLAWRPSLGILVLCALFVGACSSPATLPAGQMTTSPSVDGSLDDWGGRLSYVGDRPVSMSVLPTDSLLYVAVSIQDQQLARAVAVNGLMVWVDPSGSKQRHYGIRYPLGLRRQQPAGRSSDETASTDTPAEAFERVSLSELEVVRSDSVRRRIPARFSSGLRAEASLSPGSLIYELAVPVGATAEGRGERQYGLQAALGSTVHIGLETPEPDDDDEQVNPEAGIPSVTGRPGRRGSRGRRGRRGRQRQRRQAAQENDRPSLDLWVEVVSEATP